MTSFIILPQTTVAMMLVTYKTDRNTSKKLYKTEQSRNMAIQIKCRIILYSTEKNIRVIYQ